VDHGKSTLAIVFIQECGGRDKPATLQAQVLYSMDLERERAHHQAPKSFTRGDFNIRHRRRLNHVEFLNRSSRTLDIFPTSHTNPLAAAGCTIWWWTAGSGRVEAQKRQPTDYTCASNNTG